MTEPHQTPTISRRGMMLVLSSPSGAGKTTLARRLLARHPTLSMSVSVTTRKPRPGEVDGIDYHFLDEATFERMRETGELLEWARVHANLYGTPRQPVMEALAAGRDVLFDIDWQGARQLAALAAGDIVRVFVLPPSVAALIERLQGRGQDAPDVIRRRLDGAAQEIGHWPEYDYVIVNAVIDESLAALEAILRAERLKATRQTGLHVFAEAIKDGLARRG